jgi:long-subunit fatty acid transport protein
MTHVARKFALSLTLAALAFWPATALATTYDTFGFGSRAIAMGGAQTAAAYGPEAVFYNPALLVRPGTNMILIGHIRSAPRLRYRRAEEAPANSAYLDMLPAQQGADLLQALDIASEKQYFLKKKELRDYLIGVADDNPELVGVDFGILLPLGRGRYRNRIAVGVGIHLPMGNLVSEKFFGPTRPYYLRYLNDHRIATVVGALAIDIVPEVFSIGAGALAMAKMNGEVRYELPLGVEGEQSDIESTQEYEHNTVPILGLHYRPWENLRFGLSFKDQIYFSYNMTMAFWLALPQPLGREYFQIPISFSAISLYSPQWLSLGTGWDVTPDLILAADLRLERWSLYKPPFPKLSLDLSGIPEEYLILGEQFLGDLSQFDIPEYKVRLRDIYSPRLGAEYRAWRALQIRAGYQFLPTPVPVQDGATNILDNDTHVFSAGAGYKWKVDSPSPGAFELTFHGQLMWMKSVFVAKDESKLEDEAQDRITREGVNIPGTTGVQSTNPGYPGFSIGGQYWTYAINFVYSF